MGFTVPTNSTVFNIMNAVCNYIPIFLYLYLKPLHFRKPNYELISKYKWTIIYTVALLVLCFYNLSYAVTEFPHEILPLVLLCFTICFSSTHVNIDHILNFFRFSFLASLIIYCIPGYDVKADQLLRNSIVFKEPTILPLKLDAILTKQMGFVFDWRIMGQLAVIYLLILIINKKGRLHLLDHTLLVLVLITTFSRGPVVMALLVYAGLFVNRVLHKNWSYGFLILAISSIVAVYIGVNYISANSSTIKEFASSFFSGSRNNAIEQREGFAFYAVERSEGHRLQGLGIGALSSKNAYNKIYFGYRDKEKKHKLYYEKVGDAYWALSLGEKGILVLILFIVSSIEIFYRYKNLIFAFFYIGFAINLIGTDVPKEAMYYFCILIIVINIKYSEGSVSSNALKESSA